MVDLQVLHEVLARTLIPCGEGPRQAEANLKELESQPGFVTSLLELSLRSDVELGIRRAAAVYLKNKITRSWSPRSVEPLSDAEKHIFKSKITRAITEAPRVLREFLIVSLSVILNIDYQANKWPELLPEVMSLLQSTGDLRDVAAGLTIFKQVCRYYRWHSTQKNRELGPILSEFYPVVLRIAEAAVNQINDSEKAAEETYYELVYEFLKIYKLSTTRFLSDVIREESIATRTMTLFCQVFLLPQPPTVLTVEPPSERDSLFAVKCMKWSTANIVRTHNTYLTRSFAQLSDNAEAYAPYRKLSLTMFAPSVTRLYVEQLIKWSQGQLWLSQATLYNVISYLDAMIDVTPVYKELLDPQLDGLLGQVLFPLMCPTEDDLDLFEDDPEEFVHSRVDYSDVVLSVESAAASFVPKLCRKRKQTLPLVTEFLNTTAARLVSQPDAVRDQAGLQRLIQSLASTFLAKGSPMRSQLEPYVLKTVVPLLKSRHAYLRAASCDTIQKVSSLKFSTREILQLVFEGVLSCFLDSEHLPVQVAASQTLQALSSEEQNEDVRAALGMHITDVVRNLLEITQRIDLEPLLTVLDHFVELYPNEIMPYAVDLAAQLTNQFITLCSELHEGIGQVGGASAVADSEFMIASDDKVATGLGIMNSLANLQSNLEHQRELTARLDETITPVFQGVYQYKLLDFYPDCLSLHENTLFTLTMVPPRHWVYFDMLLSMLKQSEFDYFEDAMPVLENYIVYGGADLAASPERLGNFVSVLIEMFAPFPNHQEPTALDDPGAAFADARTRGHIMSLAVKLLEAADLQNGPMFPHIPSLVEAATLRVMADAQQQVTVPPRYNVAIVSLILGAIFNNPTLTLQLLGERQSTHSFFEMWFQTVSEFSRVDDLKLCEVSILSLLSVKLENHPVLGPLMPKLMELLARCLEALPGAVSRREELLKSEQEDDWNDDDFNEFGDDDFGDGDEEENDASTEFNDQMPLAPEVGSIGQEPSGDSVFMYERPGEQSTPDTSQAEQQTLVSGFFAEDFGEDLYAVSPLDSLNPYVVLRTVLTKLKEARPQMYNTLIESMSEGDKAILMESVQREQN